MNQSTLVAGTDTWNKDNAIAANKVVTEMGIIRKGLVEAPLDGYNPPSHGPEAERVGTKFDTSALANGNGGHVFGTTLPPAEKENLLEYLKTL